MYIPKSHITQNQITNGGEYQIATTGVEYIGPYWRYANGKLYTGATPYSNTGPTSNQLLIPLNNGTFEDPNPLIKISKLALSNGDPDPMFFPTDPTSFEYVIKEVENFDYNLLLNRSKQTVPINKIIPSPRLVQPTPQDYQFQEYMRYFSYQTNPSRQFFEVTKGTYLNIVNKNKKYLFEFFKPYFLPWRLVGTREEVYKVNSEVVKSLSNKNSIPFILSHFEGKYDQYRQK